MPEYPLHDANIALLMLVLQFRYQSKTLLWLEASGAAGTGTMPAARYP